MALDEGLAQHGQIIVCDVAGRHNITDKRINVAPAYRWLLETE